MSSASLKNIANPPLIIASVALVALIVDMGNVLTGMLVISYQLSVFSELRFSLGVHAERLPPAPRGRGG